MIVKEQLTELIADLERQQRHHLDMVQRAEGALDAARHMLRLHEEAAERVERARAIVAGAAMRNPRIAEALGRGDSPPGGPPVDAAPADGKPAESLLDGAGTVPEIEADNGSEPRSRDHDDCCYLPPCSE